MNPAQMALPERLRRRALGLKTDRPGHSDFSRSVCWTQWFLGIYWGRAGRYGSQSLGPTFGVSLGPVEFSWEYIYDGSKGLLGELKDDK
jgi:hypothetical protein